MGAEQHITASFCTARVQAMVSRQRSHARSIYLKAPRLASPRSFCNCCPLRASASISSPLLSLTACRLTPGAADAVPYLAVTPCMHSKQSAAYSVFCCSLTAWCLRSCCAEPVMCLIMARHCTHQPSHAMHASHSTAQQSFSLQCPPATAGEAGVLPSPESLQPHARHPVVGPC